MSGQPSSALTRSERWLAALLIVAGFAITVLALAIALTDGRWLIESTAATRNGASKTVVTKKYSDTLPVAAMSIGVLLILSGVFFGRLVEISLGGIATVKLMQRQLEKKVDEQVDAYGRKHQINREEIDQLKQIARKEANSRLLDQVAATPRSVELDGIADKAVQSAISEAARRYEEIRAGMRPGGARDKEMEDALAEAEEAVRAKKPSRDDVQEWFQGTEAEGARIKVLAAMKVWPDLRDADLILRAIRDFRKPFDHDRFMVLAADELRNLNDEQRGRLRAIIEKQRADGKIKEQQVRWATSERLLRLMAR